MNLDLLLINPKTSSKAISKWPPLGLAYIAAWLRKHHFSVSIIDAANLKLDLQTVLSQIQLTSPKCIGFTAYTETISKVLSQAKIIKECYPKIKIILGGAHVFSQHANIIKEYNFIDFCIRGEGEQTTLELLSYLKESKDSSNHKDFADLDLKLIKGLTFRGCGSTASDGQVVVNPDRPFVSNLDQLAFPAWDLLPMHVYEASVYNTQRKPYGTVLASRGCPFNCHYCSCRAFWGAQRQRSVENVLEELTILVDNYGIRQLCFLDDLFVANHEWAMDLCNLIKINRLPLIFSCFGKIDRMSDRLLDSLWEAGCRTLKFGIEFGDEDMLSFIGKKFKLNQVYETIASCQRKGFRIYGSFIIGYPYETIKSIEKTITLAKKLNLDYISFTRAIPYPGTALYDFCLEKGILLSQNWDDYEWDVWHQKRAGLIRLENISQEDFEKLSSDAHKLSYRPSYLWRICLRHPFTVMRALPGFVRERLNLIVA